MRHKHAGSANSSRQAVEWGRVRGHGGQHHRATAHALCPRAPELVPRPRTLTVVQQRRCPCAPPHPEFVPPPRLHRPPAPLRPPPRCASRPLQPPLKPARARGWRGEPAAGRARHPGGGILAGGRRLRHGQAAVGVQQQTTGQGLAQQLAGQRNGHHVRRPAARVAPPPPRRASPHCTTRRSPRDPRSGGGGWGGGGAARPATPPPVARRGTTTSDGGESSAAAFPDCPFLGHRRVRGGDGRPQGGGLGLDGCPPSCTLTRVGASPQSYPNPPAPPALPPRPLAGPTSPCA